MSMSIPVKLYILHNFHYEFLTSNQNKVHDYKPKTRGSSHTNITCKREKLVSTFEYLGVMITNDGETGLWSAEPTNKYNILRT